MRRPGNVLPFPKAQSKRAFARLASERAKRETAVRETVTAAVQVELNKHAVKAVETARQRAAGEGFHDLFDDSVVETVDFSSHDSGTFVVTFRVSPRAIWRDVGCYDVPRPQSRGRGRTDRA